jgi:hypothetical protein
MQRGSLIDQMSTTTRASRKTSKERQRVAGRYVALGSLAETHPELAAEWHPIRNGDLTPANVSAGMRLPAWWKCARGPDHEWRAAIWTRGRREKPTGCPFCLGQRVSVTNSLAVRHPDIAAEWDDERNWDETNKRPLTPDDFPAGSGKKVHWKCPKGPDHRWEATISGRTQEPRRRGCPYCSGYRGSVTNSVARFPELVAQWHPDNVLTPHDVAATSARTVRWTCPQGPDHVWEAPVDSRFNERGGIRGCPFCLGYRASDTNNLAALYPQLAAEWHPTKNDDLTPDQVLPNSNKRVWWKCPKAPDHEWQAWIQNRRKGDGCPFCGNRQLVWSNSLPARAEIAAEWHPSKNGSIAPANVLAASRIKYWWQ